MKKAKALLAKAGEIKRRPVQETDPNSSNKGKGKEMPPQSLKVPSPTKPTTTTATLSAGSEPKGPEPEAKGMGTKTGVTGKGKGKVAGDKKHEKKSAEIADVDILKKSMKVDGPGDEKKGDVEQDTKKPGEGAVDSSHNITPAVITDDTTKPISDNVKVTPVAATLKDDATKEKLTKPEDGAKPSKQKVEQFVTDEGDVTTPKRATKELPVTPTEPLKEKLVPTLGLTVPSSSKDGSVSLLSPQALKNAEDETLMERMARLKIGGVDLQPPKDVVPPAHTDLESDSEECETAPSGPGTPRSRAGRGSFSLMLGSDIPMSDDDDFFLDCDSASVSNFEGI